MAEPRAGARPSITAVVATRDRPALLADALASIAAQTLAPLEVRIGDDGDTPLPESAFPPGVLEIVVVRGRFGHPGAGRNAAAARARGDVLAFLDDDDRWAPDHLRGLAEAFRDPGAGFAWRDCEVVRERVLEDGRREALERAVIARDWDDALMRTDDYLPPSAWGVRRTLFERLGGFDPSFRYSEDWDFVLRAAALTRPLRVSGVTVEVRMRESGNASAEVGPERIACLERLAARHGLRPLAPKTFWEVAQVVREASR